MKTEGVYLAGLYAARAGAVFATNTQHHSSTFHSGQIDAVGHELLPIHCLVECEAF